MTRFDFLPSGIIGVDSRSIMDAVPQRLRVPLVGLSAVIAVLITIIGIDAFQLRSTQGEVDEIGARRDRTQAAVHTVAMLRARLLTRETLLARVTAIRRRNLDGANELATIGNALPTRAWIASLHSDGTRWTIDGETRDPQAVGATLVALRRAAMLRSPTLVSLRSSSENRPIDYQLTVDRSP
jgi:Tfp pilus assembly protein PilN